MGLSVVVYGVGRWRRCDTLRRQPSSLAILYGVKLLGSLSAQPGSTWL